MTNIFDFSSRKKKRGNSDFLKDESDGIVFDEAARSVDANLPELSFQVSTRDWTNQELASIYRVKQLLDSAGVPNTVERGLTDEGDPWCIFCTQIGDVFIHLCRLEHGYVLDSPNLKSPLVGIDFTDLIEQFSDGALKRENQVASLSKRLVRLRNNGKVLLHPSTLLAALIWSIYIHSEEIVLFAPEADETDIDDAVATVNELSIASSTSIENMVDGVAADGIAKIGDDMREMGAVKDGSGKMGLIYTPNTIAVGLSSIAIAFGIMHETFLDREVETADAAYAQLDLPQQEAGEADSNKTETPETRTAQFDVMASIDAALDHAEHLAERVLNAASEAAGEAVGPELAMHSVLAAPALADAAPDVDLSFDARWAELDADVTPRKSATAEEDLLEEEPAAEVIASASPVGESDTLPPAKTSEPLETFDIASLLDIKSTKLGQFEEFEIAGMQVEATFDIAEAALDTNDLLVATLTVADEDWTEATTDLYGSDETLSLIGSEADDDLTSPAGPAGPGAFDAQAQEFVQFLLARSDEVEMIYTKGDLVIFDASEAKVGVNYYAMTWRIDEDHTISTVGFRSDFEAFDLIA